MINAMVTPSMIFSFYVCGKWAVDEHCTFTTIFTTLSGNIEPASRARTGL